MVFNKAMKFFMARALARYAVGATALVIIPAPATPQVADEITITPADFNIPKTEALERIGDLESMAAVSTSTADYARTFREFQDDLAQVRPPVAEWPASDRDRIKNLEQPTEAAWQALALEEQNTRARLNERSREAEASYQQRLQQQRQDQQLQADQARTQQQLRLQEAQIRESEARSEYYEDLDYGWSTWYNPWWHNRFPGTPIHRHRRHDDTEGFIRSDRRPGSGNSNRVIIHDSGSTPKGPRTPNNYDPRH